MRLVSFNMRQGGSHRHWSEVLGMRPDLVFAQETRDPCTLSSGLIHPLDLEGAVWAPAAGGRWGSAVWLRDGGVNAIPVDGFSGWVVGGEASGVLAGTFVFSVHLPPEKGSYVRSAHRVLDAIQGIVAGADCVLGGDWNLTVAARSTEEDLTNRKDELELLARLDSEFGLSPAWRVAHQNGPLPQTLRWMRDPEIPYHCDGLFLPHGLASRVEHAAVLEGPLWSGLSDHNPLVVECRDLG